MCLLDAYSHSTNEHCFLLLTLSSSESILSFFQVLIFVIPSILFFDSQQNNVYSTPFINNNSAILGNCIMSRTHRIKNATFA